MLGAIIAERGQNLTKSKSTAFQVNSVNKVRTNDILSILGAFGIISGLALIDSQSIFPGFWVLVPTVGTVLLIHAGPSAWINHNILSLQPLVSLGLISYPLYLWHLPILTFARIIVGGVPSRELRFLCICIAVGLAWATFRFVEIPIQRRAYHQTFKAQRTTMLSLIAGLVAVSLFGSVLFWREGFPERLPAFTNAELTAFEASDESKRGPLFSLCDATLPNSVRCLLSKVPETEKLLVIGDSHGDALASGLYLAIQEVSPSVSVVIQSEGGCSPLRGVESRNQVGVSRNCLSKYESVYQWAIADKSVRTVILVSRWAERVGTAVGFGSVDGNLSSGGYSFIVGGKLVENNSDTFAVGLRYTIRSLMDSGKRVIFAHQVPEFGFYPPFCGVRPIPLNSWQIGEERCVIDRKHVDKRQKEYRKIFDFVKFDFPELVIMDPIPVFCTETQCRLKKDSMYLYSDDDHLNKLGAYYFSKKYVKDLF
jgi:hypothetical protein